MRAPSDVSEKSYTKGKYVKIATSKDCRNNSDNPPLDTGTVITAAGQFERLLFTDVANATGDVRPETASNLSDRANRTDWTIFTIPCGSVCIGRLGQSIR